MSLEPPQFEVNPKPHALGELAADRAFDTTLKNAGSVHRLSIVVRYRCRSERPPGTSGRAPSTRTDKPDEPRLRRDRARVIRREQLCATIVPTIRNLRQSLV